MNADPLLKLLSTTDAQEWARAFCEKFGGDEELMLVWFANAIETGRSAGWKQAKEELRAENSELRQTITDLLDAQFQADRVLDRARGQARAIVTPDAWSDSARRAT